MEELIHIHKTFEKINWINQKIAHREFEGCLFKNCEFTNSQFMNSSFTDCEFVDCNLSMLDLSGSSLKTVLFKNCKLLGISFQACNDFLFSVSFYDCILDYASFSQKKMLKTLFQNCSLKEVTFIGSNLSNSVFDNCNLELAIFNETQLAGVDFTTSYHFNIDPVYNPMRKAKFSMQGIPGLLGKYDIKIE